MSVECAEKILCLSYQCIFLPISHVMPIELLISHTVVFTDAGNVTQADGLQQKTK